MTSPLEEAQKREHVGKKKEERALDRINRYTMRFQKAEAAVQPKHAKWAELDAFDRGEQWKNVSLPPWIPKPVANYIRYTRQLKRANLATSIPRATFIPLTPEDQEFVGRLQKAYNHVWETERIDRTVRRCIDRSLLQGSSVVYVYNDDDYIGGKYKDGGKTNKLYQGRIKVKRIPNANIFFDPDETEDLQNCKYIELTDITPLSQVKRNPAYRRYCKQNGTLKKLDELTVETISGSDSENGLIYDRDIKPGHTGAAVSGDEDVTVHCHMERYMTEEGRWQLDMSYYLYNTDFFLLRLEDVKPSRYPLAKLNDEDEEGELWGHSQAMDQLEIQKIINKTAQTASIIATLHQNPQKVVDRNSGINAQELARTGTLPGKVWVSNTDVQKSIHNVQPPDIPRGLFEVEDRMKQDIREMTGVNEAYTGQSVGSLTTSSGVNSLIERATIRDKDKMIQIDEFVEEISDLIVQLILYSWKDERPVTETSPNGEPIFSMYEPISEEDAENIEWRVKVDVYAKAPTTQASRRQQADTLMQMQGQFQYNPPIITPEEWIQFQDFDMKEDILRRMEHDRTVLEQEQQQDMAQILIQMTQQIDQLRAQGISEENIPQVAQQLASEILAQRQQPGQANAPTPPGERQGVTGQQAMMAMARGM